MTLRRILQFAGAMALVLTSANAAPNLKGQDWPQWRGPARDGVWTETGLLEKFAGPEIKIKQGHIQPTLQLRSRLPPDTNSNTLQNRYRTRIRSNRHRW